MSAFITEDEITASPDGFASVEAQELVRLVLIPWRGQKLRRIASMYVAHSQQMGGELFVLRTYYAGGESDDEKFREWLQQANPEDESFGGTDGRWWRVLDDAALFNLGPEEKWQRIYDILPELAAPSTRRTFDDCDVDHVRECVSYLGDTRDAEEDDYEEVIMETAAASAGYLLLVEQEDFEEGEFGLVFRDTKGNIVKNGTIKPDEVQYLPGCNSRNNVSESGYWRDAAIGSNYKTRGKIMSRLLPIVMSELE